MAQRVVAFLVAGPRDDATSAVARLALERGFLGSDFLFGTAEQSAGVASVAAGLTLMARSIEHRPHGARGLSHFLATAERGGPTSVILFVPPVPGPWLPATLAACRGKRATVMIGIDGLRSKTRAEGVRRALFIRHDDGAHDASELATVVQGFRAAGCSVVVYDRPAGRVLNNDQIGHVPQGAAA
jgi:hypothetical protein